MSKFFPKPFTDGTFDDLLAEEPATLRSLNLLIEQIQRRSQMVGATAGPAANVATGNMGPSGAAANTNPGVDGNADNAGQQMNAVNEGNESALGDASNKAAENP